MPPKHPLLQKCLSYLEALPHLKVETEVGSIPYAGDVLADGLIALHSPQGSATYIVEIKSDTTIENLSLIVDYFNVLKQRLSHGERPLLIAKRLSKLVVKRLIQENLEFIDSSGNCYLNSPALYLMTSSTTLETEQPTKLLEITPSMMLVMYGLLQLKSPAVTKPDFERIAISVGSSVRYVEQTLDRLYKLQYLQRQRGGEYQIVDYRKLLERWELGYVETLRPKCVVGTYAPLSNKKFSDIQTEMINNAETEGYLIGGELGGAIATNYLRPIGATLHISGSPIDLSLKLKLKPDPQGTITFLQRFSSNDVWADRPTLAHPLLIHAELMTLSMDGRIRETSDRFYSQFLSIETI